MQYGLKQDTIEKINKVLAVYPQLGTAILYGSRAKGNFKNGSDIDLAFKGEGLDLKLINNISNDFDDLLLPYSFDLSIFSQISDANLIDHINRVGMIFYEREPQLKI